MNDKPEILPVDHIQRMILTIRGIPIMVDRDLAEVYRVETKALNQAVKRNAERFPREFRFQLTEPERRELVTKCDRFESMKHSSAAPFVYTEQGVAMLSAILHSDTAVQVSIRIITAFVEMRRFLAGNANLFDRIASVEKRQLLFEHSTDKNFEKVFAALRSVEPPKQGIFYDGQVYDAYVFVADLIRRARKALILIDNYLDDTVLTLFSKRAKGVTVRFYTKSISKQLALDLERHNEQYDPIEIREFPDAHDRFLVIDGVELYHIGASLKDLGKKWFAFSRIENGAFEMLKRLEAVG